MRSTILTSLTKSFLRTDKTRTNIFTRYRTMKKLALFFFGKYIKKQAWKSCASFTISRQMFEWVTDAPVWQWRQRLWCARHSYYDRSYEKLYDWLTHKREIRVQDTETSDNPLKELNEELTAMYNDLQYDTDEYSRKLIEERRKRQSSSGM